MAESESLKSDQDKLLVNVQPSYNGDPNILEMSVPLDCKQRQLPLWNGGKWVHTGCVLGQALWSLEDGEFQKSDPELYTLKLGFALI